MQPFDPELGGERVEVDVTGLRQRFDQRDAAVAAALPVAETMAAARQRIPTRAGTGRGRCHETVLETRECDHRLDRRARRIGAAQRAVEQRTVQILVERRELGAGQAAREAVGIESGAAHERNYLAVARVERDDGSTLSLHRLFGDPLHFEVERQVEVGPGLRRDRAQRLVQYRLAVH